MKLLQKIATYLLALIWILPLFYTFWAAFHSEKYSANFDIFAPLSIQSFYDAWNQAPFLHYLINTFTLVTIILIGQMILCTLAAYAFAKFDFYGKSVAFFLVLMQLMIMPENLILENYKTISYLNLVDTTWGMAIPYIASAFGIFLLRQTFKTIPTELDEAAKMEGCSQLGILFRVYIPLSKSTYLAYALVSVSYHWNNFLWPLIIANSNNVKPLTVGLAIFAAPESGVQWSTISAATLISVAPLLLAFLIFQKQFVNSFLHTGIK
ncbi:binding-protein-dependent transport systems inner membrane component [Arcobacter nitrofigilis DSM 7299]|uniref:Binding-protein-dependent transport systems inner membrane component n=1 Tax=Arcobacter nitrofigilis (strain ATCC 33309 / DSM 7299 / CCUG 15893 / LMG 7604 / NCTC 12251 / CI) TaxID=572480 RepID=D5V575_ARCNC|nr:carbohydrate ABC transporter permease [Arcobacter nitrofigilis]ADG93010.1 binding-protein-dependent transport systems inner membrane component [Arcobacter nitrofigilis DSM 7299]